MRNPAKRVITHAPHMAPKPPEQPPRGLGDLVASVAQPIARAIDAVAGTNLKGCGGCKKRQEALNHILPEI